MMLSLMLFGTWASARCVYDSTGRHLIYDDTIRGRRRAAAQAKLDQQNKLQAAAAAKVDYEAASEELDKTSTLKSNYIQSRNAAPRNLPSSNLKSNF